MTLHTLALFGHVLGAILLFVSLTLQGVGIRGLSRARTLEQVGEWAPVIRLPRIVGPLSAALILIPGLYMMATAWGWKAWIVAGVVGWVLIALLGATAGIRLTAAVARIVDQKPAAPESLHSLRSPSSRMPWWMQLSLAVGIVFLMTAKPGLLGASLTLIVAAGVGAAAGGLAVASGARPDEPAT